MFMVFTSLGFLFTNVKFNKLPDKNGPYDFNPLTISSLWQFENSLDVTGLMESKFTAPLGINHPLASPTRGKII